MKAFGILWLKIMFPILLAMVLIWFYQLSRLFNYLRDNHPEEYQALGEPKLFDNASAGRKPSIVKFIKSHRPTELEDQTLKNRCTHLKWFYYVFDLIFFSCIALILAMSITHSW